jgi:hypothetical protein
LTLSSILETPFKANKTYSIMNLIRWILMIPFALLVAGIIGGLTNMLGLAWFGEWLGWIISGAFSASTFLLTSLWIAPVKSNRLKSILCIAIIILGLVSAIGGFMSELQVSSLAGITMAIFGIGFWSIEVDQIFNLKN